MAVRVVDVLEVVHIEHEQREWQLMAQAARDLLFGTLLEEAAVVQVGEGIGDDLPTDAVVFLGRGEGGLNMADQSLEYHRAEVGECVRAGRPTPTGTGSPAVELEGQRELGSHGRREHGALMVVRAGDSAIPERRPHRAARVVAAAADVDLTLFAARHAL